MQESFKVMGNDKVFESNKILVNDDEVVAGIPLPNCDKIPSLKRALDNARHNNIENGAGKVFLEYYNNVLFTFKKRFGEKCVNNYWSPDYCPEVSEMDEVFVNAFLKGMRRLVADEVLGLSMLSYSMETLNNGDSESVKIFSIEKIFS